MSYVFIGAITKYTEILCKNAVPSILLSHATEDDRKSMLFTVCVLEGLF